MNKKSLQKISEETSIPLRTLSARTFSLGFEKENDQYFLDDHQVSMILNPDLHKRGKRLTEEGSLSVSDILNYDYQTSFDKSENLRWLDIQLYYLKKLNNYKLFSTREYEKEKEIILSGKKEYLSVEDNLKLKLTEKISSFYSKVEKTWKDFERGKITFDSFVLKMKKFNQEIRSIIFNHDKLVKDQNETNRLSKPSEIKRKGKYKNYEQLEWMDEKIRLYDLMLRKKGYSAQYHYEKMRDLLRERESFLTEEEKKRDQKQSEVSKFYGTNEIYFKEWEKGSISDEDWAEFLDSRAENLESILSKYRENKD